MSFIRSAAREVFGLFVEDAGYAAALLLCVALALPRLPALGPYAGTLPSARLAAALVAVNIVRESSGQVGFVVRPDRQVVERLFEAISRNRRLWKESKATVASVEAPPLGRVCHDAAPHIPHGLTFRAGSTVFEPSRRFGVRLPALTR